MGFMCCLAKCFCALSVLVLVLLFIPNIPPDVTYSSFKVVPSQPREGPLAKNYILDDAERLFDGHFNGPESVASRAKNEIFVSMQNGDIVRIWGQDFDKSEVVANMGPGCAGHWEEPICGRPLGLRFRKDKKLVVADSYLGIFTLDVATGKKERLVDPSVPIGGATPKIIDDLDIDDEGNIYWSDASSKVNLSDGLVELLSDPSARLIKYDAKTQINEVLLKGLHFANGVQLSPDQKFVLVTETFRHRVMRYWLKGPKAGTSEVFVSGLPGMPDNIRARKEGGYYVSLVTTRHPDDFDLFEFTANKPGLRKVITRATWLVQRAVQMVNSYLPNVFCAKFFYKIFHLGVISEWNHKGEAIVAEVDEEGKIIGSLQGSNGVVKFISETEQVGDYLFFGSPYNKYLARLHVDKIKNPTKKPTTDQQDKKTEL